MSNHKVINARSPYYIKSSATGAASVRFQIKIYSGDQTPLPSGVQYTLIKNTTTPATGNPYAVIEISELIRDYIYTDYYTEAVDAVWVYVTTSIFDGPNGTGSLIGTPGSIYYLALDGYGYFEEGVNPRESIDPDDESYTPMLLQDNLTVYFVPGEQITLPFFSEAEPLIDFTFSGGSGVEWQALDEYWQVYDGMWNSSLDDVQIVDSIDSLDKIQYVGIFPTTGIATGDTAVITSTTGNAQTQTITFKSMCAGKYPDVKILFYNKYGAIQELWAHKKSVKSLNTTSETYNRNIMNYDSLDYSVFKHATSRFDVNGRESIVVNTDFMDESINDPVKQLMLSDQVWLDIGNDTFPVVVKTSSLTEKTGVNDKMVQYTFEFEYAYDKIQNVR
jgi:hypothetical protein